MNFVKKQKKKDFQQFLENKKICEILHLLIANRHFNKSYLVLTKYEESLKKILVFYLAVKSVLLG